MQTKRVTFGRQRSGYGFLAPELVILSIFFYWPAATAVVQSFYVLDPWGARWIFVGLDNYRELFAQRAYHSSVVITIVYTFCVTVLAMASGIILALFADRVIHGRSAYRNLLIWPYAIAPVVAGAFWLFLLDPNLGILTHAFLRPLGVNWNPLLIGPHALTLVIIAAAWKMIAYNFIFFLAGLQTVPRSTIEAAAIDGAGPVRRTISIIMPQMTPMLFFLLVVNIVNAFFDGFSLVHAITGGGPAGWTNIMVHKVYRDGFLGHDLGLASAQSVVLLAVVICVTAFQFRLLERRVHYGG